MLESVSGIKRFFFIQRLVFRGLCFDITSVEFKIRRPFCIWLSFVCCIIYILAMGRYCWENREDLNEFSTMLAPVLFDFVSLVKFLVLLHKRKDLVKLLHSIWALTIEANSDELSVIAEENAKDFMFSLCYYISVIVGCSIALILPLITTTFVYFKTAKLQFTEILKTSYPFDQNQPLNYLVTFCLLLASCYLMGHIAVELDTLYSWSTLNTAAQFRILKLKLQKVALSHPNSAMDYGLCRCIRRHQKVIGIAGQIDMFFRTIIFTEVLINCVLFCFIAYQLGHSHGMNLEYLPFLIAFFIIASTRLTMICYCGQRIQDESQHISDFVYETFPWHSMTIRSKKLLILLIMRAQKCCSLSGVLFIANWKLFLWVARTNYSYISLLWRLDENKSIEK